MTAPVPPIWFDVPDAFTAFDLGEDPRPRVEGLLTRTPALLDDERAQLVATQERMIERMREEHVIYAAHGLFRTPGDRPQLSIAQFTAAVHPVDVGGGEVLDAIAARLDVPGLRRQVGFLPLAVGRALAVMEDRRFSTERGALGQLRHRDHVVRQVQLMLPFPDRRHLAVLALATEFLRDWGHYVELMGVVAASVRFSDPGPSGSGPPARMPPDTGPPRAGAIRAALDGKVSV